MMHDWQDLSGISEQILANVSVVFPLISPHAITPTAHPNGNVYNIIVRRMTENSYRAVVVYGPTNRVFAVGTQGQTDKEALLVLLDTTHALIGQLYTEGKLPFLNEENKRMLISGGIYEPGAGC